MNSKRVAIAWTCFLAGIGIYLLFRSREHLGFMLVDAVGLGTAADRLRASVEGITPPEFVRFCLPDGLWTISYMLFVDHIFRDQSLKARIIWVSIIPVIGVLSELLQLAGIVPGVYDPLDLVVYMLPYMVYSAYIIYRYTKISN